ncbi:MlaA family lipoprotein [Dokdonella koreensis]|uniref:Surface lipoprotein n=1 Tax=Dokdonella koreensis DS-123 TaxID=1300342 RepID=A0A160DVS6_9GAMM|nr:VacJ family lipoprotein [Dokdonella koreensis]ANB18668.1 Surface lipoprotein [Dokdonella koreensis DS-123]
MPKSPLLNSLRPFALALGLVLLSACTIAPPRTDDPYERFNRKMYTFNDTVDRVAIRPVAVGYRKITTPNMRRVVSNFFANIRMPITIANDLLQGKPGQAGRNTGRFVINTTLGFLGLFDPASEMNLPPNSNDFGITLAKWGVPDGPYLVLPLLGPTTTRDVWRTPVDSYYFDPLSWYAREHDLTHNTEYLPQFVYLVTLRSSGIDAEGLLEGVYDPYVFFRDAYRQRRLYDVYDGEPPVDVIEKLQGTDDVDVDQLLEEQQQYEQRKGGG